jgi:primary-amine oxidase
MKRLDVLIRSAMYRTIVAAPIVMYGALAFAAHPLDPLSREELATAISVLRDAGDIDATTRFALIDLDEPSKVDVLAWKQGQAFVRKAFIVLRRDRTVYEAVVDLAARKVERWDAIPNVQSALVMEELYAAHNITRADPAWQAAMRKRGYTEFEKLICHPNSAGYSADPAEEGRRLVRVACLDISGSHVNFWGNPIDGLHAVVDLDQKKVIQLIDTGIVPISRDTHEFAGADQPAPADISANQKRNFSLDGNEVHWNKWSFHFRMGQRVGLILSLLRFEDHGRQRMVLYRGSVAEMFVPYMDSDRGWSFRTYMDVGEYDGFGRALAPLMPGIDCPADAAFIDTTLPNERGDPIVGKSAICIFERSTAAPLWRHTEINRAYAGRPGRELVVRTIPSAGNYDYVIDWVLTEAGALRIDVGATGVDQVKGVAARAMTDPSAATDTAYGMLVAPNLTSVNHDHFLSFRLDVDIDGSANTLVRQRLLRQSLDGSGGRRSLWRVAEQNITEEGPLGDDVWRIINPNLTNKLGQHPGYELRAEHPALSLLARDDFPQQRAAFSAAPLWITAYDSKELYAAGPYPNQSKGGDGLPAYVAQHRPVVNADITLWYTMGFHHLPRPEDWPILPTIWHTVSLVPYGFFDHNPSLDGPEAAASEPAE